MLKSTSKYIKNTAYINTTDDFYYINTTDDFYIVRYSSNCVFMFEFSDDAGIDDVRKAIVEKAKFLDGVDEEIIFSKASDLEKQVINLSTEKHIKGFDLLNKFLKKYDHNVYKDIEEYVSDCSEYKYIGVVQGQGQITPTSHLAPHLPKRFMIRDSHAIFTSFSHHSREQIKLFDLENSREVIIVTDVKLKFVED